MEKDWIIVLHIMFTVRIVIIHMNSTQFKRNRKYHNNQ